MTGTLVDVVELAVGAASLGVEGAGGEGERAASASDSGACVARGNELELLGAAAFVGFGTAVAPASLVSGELVDGGCTLDREAAPERCSDD